MAVLAGVLFWPCAQKLLRDRQVRRHGCDRGVKPQEPRPHAPRRRPSGSFAAAFPVRRAYRARCRAVLATWPRPFRVPATSVGFAVPSQCCSASAGEHRLVGVSHPPAVSPPRPPRVSSSRDPPEMSGGVVGRVAAAPGVWPRGRSRAVFPVGPAKAFVHRAKQVDRPGLPWVFRPLPGLDRRPPHLASKVSTARGLLARLDGPPAVSGRRVVRALRRVRGRRLVGPPVLPTDRHPA
jgi:hypothetical protein